MPGRLTRLHTLNTTGTRQAPRPRLRPRGLPPALEPHLVYVTDDPVEAARYGNDLLGHHRVLVDPGATGFEATFNAVLVRDVTIGYLDFATAVELDITELSRHYLVIVPATGTSTVRNRDRTVQTSPVMAAVPAPRSAMTLRCDPDVAHLVVRIDRTALDVHLSRLLGRSVDQAIEFDLGFDLSTGGASRWNFAVQMLHAELYDPQSLLHERVGLGQLEEFVMSSLLYGLRSNYTELLTTSRQPERRAVRAARDFIERNLSQPLTVGDIAEAAGVSVRGLQAQFLDDLDQTPTGYLRNRRLERARADLADSVPGGGRTVTDVAARWGFNHLGRFAATYRSRFGESPSDTLRS